MLNFSDLVGTGVQQRGIAVAMIGTNRRVLVFCLIKLFYNKIIEYRCTGTFSPVNETLCHHIPRREICSSTFLTRERESEENLDTTCTIHRCYFSLILAPALAPALYCHLKNETFFGSTK